MRLRCDALGVHIKKSVLGSINFIWVWLLSVKKRSDVKRRGLILGSKFISR